MIVTPDVIHVGDIGTIFQVTVLNYAGGALSLVGATSTVFLLQHSSGTTISRVATFITDGSDGGLQWATTLATDLAQAGVWQIQAVVHIPGGTFSSTTGGFTVLANL